MKPIDTGPPPENERPERRLKRSGPQNFPDLDGNIVERATPIKRLLGHRSWSSRREGGKLWATHG